MFSKEAKLIWRVKLKFMESDVGKLETLRDVHVVILVQEMIGGTTSFTCGECMVLFVPDPPLIFAACTRKVTKLPLTKSTLRYKEARSDVSKNARFLSKKKNTRKRERKTTKYLTNELCPTNPGVLGTFFSKFQEYRSCLQF